MDEDQIDDIPVTEGEPELEPARQQSAGGIDYSALTQAMGSAMAPMIANAIKEAIGAVAPKPEPERPRGLGDALRARMREDLGLGDDLAEQYTRAAAYDTLSDQYGDDPAIKGALQQRTSSARLIEALAEQARRNRALEERLNKREADEQAQRKRAEQVAQLHQLAESGGLRKVAPNLFAGQLTPAHKKLLESLDVETLERILPQIDEIVGAARPRSRRLASAPGGTGRVKSQPFRVVPDSAYDDMIDRLVAGEESN